MANLSIITIEEISKQLKQKNDNTLRIDIKDRGELVCHFCDKRYIKDKMELKKQINRAKEILKTPSKAEIIKRSKFLININNKNNKNNNDKKFTLNDPLIIKYKLLLGIKGYFTNHKTANNIDIVNKYKQL